MHSPLPVSLSSHDVFTPVMIFFFCFYWKLRLVKRTDFISIFAFSLSFFFSLPPRGGFPVADSPSRNAKIPAALSKFFFFFSHRIPGTVAVAWGPFAAEKTVFLKERWKRRSAPHGLMTNATTDSSDGRAVTAHSGSRDAGWDETERGGRFERSLPARRCAVPRRLLSRRMERSSNPAQQPGSFFFFFFLLKLQM